MAIIQTLHVEAGATYDAVEFVYLEDDGVTPVDLTDWTARLVVRDEDTAAKMIDIVPTIAVETATISFTFTAAQTALLTGQNYVYAIELKHPSNEPVVQIARGQVTVLPEVVY